MDAMYRLQRHVYDATRKFYLLGRDQLIAELAVPQGGSVLEIGCGTARNLIAIASAYPDAACYGIDVSRVMLETAETAIDKAGLHRRIRTAFADATAIDSLALFGRPHFDRVVISYALSMIPQWQKVMRAALDLAGPDGEVHIVDFGDQTHLPDWFRVALFAWLRKFSVTPRIELPLEAQHLANMEGRSVKVTRPFGGYAVLARLSAANPA
jgi:S-adenosylmethionine-diacylgycerolhomoserine-N-methlytransferase